MLTDLEEILRDIDRDVEIRAVVLTGAGKRAFCVGADIEAWSVLEPVEMWRRWVRDGHRVFDELASLRQPVIAAVNGFALGGGLELMLAADIRIAAASASFATPEVKIATLPGWGGTKRLPETIGIARAKELIFSGRRIDAVTAERWGLVNRIADAAEVCATAIELATEIAVNAPRSVQLAKQAIDGGGMALEAMAGALAGFGEDAKEGISAFRERRLPRFTGK
jgi:enoyl-CoA hydratase/carnithine racemase